MERRFLFEQKIQKVVSPCEEVSRLKFTEEEYTDPALEKPIQKAVKAADKMVQAQANIPKQKTMTRERTFDAGASKPKMSLHFEGTDKPKLPSKLSHKIKNIPQRELMAKIHKELRERETDNMHSSIHPQKHCFHF